jgi:hypothetical protein
VPSPIVWPDWKHSLANGSWRFHSSRNAWYIVSRTGLTFRRLPCGGRFWTGLVFGVRHCSGWPVTGLLLTRPRRQASVVARAARPPLSAAASPGRGRGTALFGPDGEIFFRKVEGSSAFLYSVREDGSGLRKAAEPPVVGLSGVYPNRKWLLIGVSPVGEVIFPVTGGAPFLTHLHPPPLLRWTGDGKYLFVVGAANQTWANTTSCRCLPARSCLGVLHAPGIFHRKRSWQSCRDCGPYRQQQT